MNRMNKVKLSRNFYLYEFESPETKEVIIFDGLVSKLQLARDYVKKALVITSGYRTEKYNMLVGGKEKSQHRVGCAVDISVVNHQPFTLKSLLEQVGFKQVIYYKEKNFIHAALFKKNPF